MAAGAGATGASRWPGAIAVLLVALVGASPASAQGSASARVSVEIPPVSYLDVDPMAGGNDSRTGGAQLRVRANHAWRVLVGAPAGASGTFRVRVSGEAGSQRLAPGREVELVVGGRGDVAARVEWSWDGAEGAAPPPLTYRLASGE